jgi:hypothetical protein
MTVIPASSLSRTEMRMLGNNVIRGRRRNRHRRSRGHAPGAVRPDGVLQPKPTS